MLGAITAFRMTVTRLEGKFKLNQHRKGGASDDEGGLRRRHA